MIESTELERVLFKSALLFITCWTGLSKSICSMLQVRLENKLQLARQAKLKLLEAIQGSRAKYTKASGKFTLTSQEPQRNVVLSSI